MKPEQKEALLVQSDARHPERLADGAEYADGQRPADMRATLSVLALKRTLAKAAHAPTDRELIASPREFHGSRPKLGCVLSDGGFTGVQQPRIDVPLRARHRLISYVVKVSHGEGLAWIRSGRGLYRRQALRVISSRSW